MKILVDDGVQRYNLPLHKIISVQQKFDREIPAVVTALIDGKVRTFNCRDNFWTIADRIKAVGWKKIFNEAGIKSGPWG